MDASKPRNEATIRLKFRLELSAKYHLYFGQADLQERDLHYAHDQIIQRC